MKQGLLVGIMVVSQLALAACQKNEQQATKEAAPAARQSVPAPLATPAPAAKPAPPSETKAEQPVPAAPINADEAMGTLKEQALAMTPEQRQAAVLTARRAAEEAARAAGQPDDQVAAAADAAEKAINDALVPQQ